METTASSMFPGTAQPRLDPISPSRRIDFDAPMLFGTIGGRPVAFARPDQRRATADEPLDLTVPLTMSRLRRAIDIERNMDAAPYVPSPLFGVNPMPLSAYYTDSLTYEQAKVISATLSQAERSAMLQKAEAALPSCYTQELRSCVRSDEPGPVIKNCADINEGYVADWDHMLKRVQDMPVCPAPLSTALLVGGALAAFTLGVGLGMLASR